MKGLCHAPIGEAHIECYSRLLPAAQGLFVRFWQYWIRIEGTGLEPQGLLAMGHEGAWQWPLKNASRRSCGMVRLIFPVSGVDMDLIYCIEKHSRQLKIVLLHCIHGTPAHCAEVP